MRSGKLSPKSPGLSLVNIHAQTKILLDAGQQQQAAAGMYEFFKKNEKQLDAEQQCEILYSLANLYKLLDQEKSLGFAEQAYALRPGGVRLILLLFSLYLIKNDKKAARKFFRNLPKNLPPGNLAEIYAHICHFSLEGRPLFDKMEQWEGIYQFALKYKNVFAVLPPAIDNYHAYLLFKLNEKNNAVEMLKYSLPLCKNANKKLRMIGFYYSGNANFIKKEIKLAISFYDKALDLYAGATPDEQLHLNTLVPLIYGNLARLYEGEYDIQYIDHEKAVASLKASAAFDFGDACLRLGYKYHMGEDVEVDLDLAVHYYEIAVAQNIMFAKLNLGNLLLTEKGYADIERGLALTKEALTDPCFKPHAMENLCFYYSNAYKDAWRENNRDKIIALQADFLLYAFATAELGIFTGVVTKAKVFFYGLADIPRDMRAGIKLLCEYLEKTQDEDYIPYINNFYGTLIEEENNPEICEKYFNELKVICDAYHYPIDCEQFNTVNIEKRAIVKSERRFLETYAKNDSATIITRITELLKYSLTDFSGVTLSTFTQKLGGLIYQTLEKRHLHYKNSAQFVLYFEEMLAWLNDKEKVEHLSLANLAVLITGLSKFYFTNKVLTYKKIIVKLYARAVKKQNELSIAELVNIIYSATRFDSKIEIFGNVRLLIETALTKTPNLNNNNAIYLLNAIVFLSATFTPAYPVEQLSPLIARCHDFLRKSNNKIELNLGYYALAQLANCENWSRMINPMVIDSINLKLAKLTVEPKTSYLQTQVTNCVTYFFPPNTVQVEKVIGNYPVDIFVELSKETGFIINVDGPSHYWHGLDEVEEPKLERHTKFRNAFLKTFYKTLCISYLDWNKLKTHNEQREFVRTFLTNNNILIPERTSPVNGRNLFFSGKQSNVIGKVASNNSSSKDFPSLTNK